jgi:heat shock protein HslJ
MNKLNFPAFVILVLLMACATPRKTTPETSLEGGWVLAVFPYQKKTLAEVFGTRVIEMQFTKATGSLSGTTSCNRFNGSYTATDDTLLLSQTRLLTKMACPGYNEQLFLDALNRVNRYHLNEGQLELLQDTALVMIFARKL